MIRFANAVKFLAPVLLALVADASLAVGKKYFSGHMYTFERSERFESSVGGVVTYLRPFGHDAFEEPSDAVLIEGVLSAETLVHVRRLLPKEAGVEVYLDSPGGDLSVGIALGRLFRERDSVAISTRGAQCKSACALAFLGATTRLLLGDTAALGFHRQYRLIDGRVTYGDLNEDRAAIESYLRSVQVTGLTAEEITSTTGEVTFSETVLKDRGLISLTRSERMAHYKQMLAYSGMTQFEILSVICSKYEGVRPRGASISVLSNSLACSGRVPALREPFLRAAVSPLPLSTEDEERLLLADDAWKVLHSTDPAAVAAFNVRSEASQGSYQRWLERRQTIRQLQAAPAAPK